MIVKRYKKLNSELQAKVNSLQNQLDNSGGGGKHGSMSDLAGPLSIRKVLGGQVGSS
jgi:hypothetical protein